MDLWAKSTDGATVHLFELKAKKNASVGILPEAFYYVRLLHHLQAGCGGGRTIAGNDDAIQAVRDARRLHMWLVAETYHPLILSRGKSPLAWLNNGMQRDDVQFSILPLEATPAQTGRTWNWKERWPMPASGQSAKSNDARHST